MAYTASKFFSDTFIKCLTSYTNSLKNARSAEENWGAVRILCDYLKKDFLAIDETDVEKFFNYMAQRAQHGTLKNTTINSRRSIYNRLSLYLAEQYPELGFDNPFVLIRPLSYKAGIKPSMIPSLNEVDAVLNASRAYPMYYLILSLAFRAALTATNIISLRMDNIQNTDEGLCIHFSGDGYQNDHIIILPEDIAKLITDYTKGMTSIDSEGHLFYNKYGNPLTLRNLDKAVEKFVVLSGITNRYTLKDLRSRAILDMIKATVESNGNVNNVASYAGIKDLRLNSYVNAYTLAEKCPAGLVNLRVKPFTETAQEDNSKE